MIPGLGVSSDRAYDNGQSIKHLYGQTNLPYIISEDFTKFAKDNECLDNFSPYHKHCTE